MSDVARYVAAGDGVVRFDDQGPLVVWQDYARLQAYLTNCQSEADRLKAEVERLRKFNDEALAHIAKEERKSRERLDIIETEVERLRKAGDAMHRAIKVSDPALDWAIECWNAAKEGKQS